MIKTLSLLLYRLKTPEVMLAVIKPEATKLQDVVLNSLKFNTTHDVVQTPLISGACVDGVFCKNGVLTGVFEIKCWQNTLKNTERFLLGKWFTDKYKFESMQNLSKILCVPSYLIAYLEGSNLFYVFKVCNKLGVYCFPFVQKEIQMKNTTFGNNLKIVKRQIVEFEICLAKPCKII